MHRDREVPLTAVADVHGFAVVRRHRSSQLTGLERAAVPDQLAVELQVADVAAGLPVGQAFAVDMVENLGIGEVVVEREIAGDLLVTDPIDQLDTQVRMVDEGLLLSGADLLRAETAEVQGVVLAARTNVVDKEVVLGNFVTLLGVVPKVTGIRDEFAVVINED